MFDWEHFLDSHSIAYATRGGNIGRGHIGINCPWCGDDDSYHLGISLANGFYHCWREPVPGSHSGRSPYRLIEQLLGVGRQTARAIVQAGENAIIANDRTFGDDILRKLGRPPKLRAGVLEFPREYFRLDSSPRAKRLYYPYLTGRGYTERQVDWLVKRYRLCYAARGVFVYRVIVPVYYQNRLVTWTGRHIGDDELRYRTLSHDADNAIRSGQPQAVENIKNTLFDFDRAVCGGKTLVITEGVFDAMRVSFLGYDHGIQAVALFGKQANQTQLSLLGELMPHYRRTVALLDADASSLWSSEIETNGLRWIPQIKQGVLRKGVKDPAMPNREQFGQLFSVQ